MLSYKLKHNGAVHTAKKYLKTPYKQQYGIPLRTYQTKAALQYMDCSELICRVLAADEFTDGVQNMPTGDLLDYFPKNGWKEVSVPKRGDIVVWKGHTALVEAYDAAKKKGVSVIHATNYGNVSSVVQEDYKLSYYEGKGAKFFTPIKDKPDGVDFSWTKGTIFEGMFTPFDFEVSSAVNPTTLLGPVGWNPVSTNVTAPSVSRNATPMQKVTPKGPPSLSGAGTRTVTFRHKAGVPKLNKPMPKIKLGKG